MALSNAEKQQRWRQRNQVVLTADAREIARQLIDMEDQCKLRQVAKYLNDHLRHPERTLEQREIALGITKIIDGLNGPMSKTDAIAKLARAASLGRAGSKEPKPNGSWLVVATTRDGKHWVNGVRLRTKAEAEAYGTIHVPDDLKKDLGYVTTEIRRDDAPPNCSITRKRKGGRTYLGFEEGQCGLLGWHPERTSKKAAGQ